jgi:hypothetical protein
MKKQNVLMSVLLASSIVCSAFAGIEGEGSKGGGGGDARTEGRIDEIRADILKWVQEGGSKALKLPQGLSSENYAKSMEDFLRPQEVVVTAIKSAEENPNDEELNVRVDGQPKTCKGFFSKKDQRPHILCNVERFWEMSESDQYRQIHHEYAGLALIEKNIGAASDYSISQQINDYLVPITVLRLAVKNNRPVKAFDNRCTVYVDFRSYSSNNPEMRKLGIKSPRYFQEYKELMSRSEREQVKKALEKRGYQITNQSNAVFEVNAFNYKTIYYTQEEYSKPDEWVNGEGFVSATGIAISAHHVGHAFLEVIHKASGINKSVESTDAGATIDSRRADYQNRMASALTINDYNAAKNEYDSQTFSDQPKRTAVEQMVTAKLGSIPSCSDFYGKKVLTDSQK